MLGLTQPPLERHTKQRAERLLERLCLPLDLVSQEGNVWAISGMAVR